VQDFFYKIFFEVEF